MRERLGLVAKLAIAAGAYVAGRTAIAVSRRYDFQNRLVVITGGSRGLGLVIARRLADEGAALVLCARDVGELAQAADELDQRTRYIATYACDLTQPPEIKSLFERIRREIGAVDVLINNAGVMQVGPLETMTLADYHQAMMTHFWAPLFCSEQVIPEMRRRQDGRIVNISSIGGEIGVPHMAPYCASKFALNGWSQAARAELARHGVYMTTVSPGLMRTGSPRNALFKGQHRAEFTWFSISGGMPLLSMSAEQAARRIVGACRYGRPKLVLSLPAKLAVAMNAIAPELTAETMALAARALPEAGGVGRASIAGKHSTTAWSPSVLTALNDRAAERNNEIPPSEAAAASQPALT
jgi:NAD(P)-dependent dehydrogenase (short-subunit alcohol dehydrogenase family)